MVIPTMYEQAAVNTMANVALFVVTAAPKSTTTWGLLGTFVTPSKHQS
jgi:hypothetical protein